MKNQIIFSVCNKISLLEGKMSQLEISKMIEPHNSQNLN